MHDFPCLLFVLGLQKLFNEPPDNPQNDNDPAPWSWRRFGLFAFFDETFDTFLSMTGCLEYLPIQ